MALLQLEKPQRNFRRSDLLFARARRIAKPLRARPSNLEESAGRFFPILFTRRTTRRADWVKAEGHLRRAIERDPRSLTSNELARVFIEDAQLTPQEHGRHWMWLRDPQPRSLSAASYCFSCSTSRGSARIDAAITIDQAKRWMHWAP